MTVFAHAGHWTTGVIEVAPFIIMVVWLLTTTWRDRRRTAREGGPAPGEPTGSGERDGDRPRRGDR